LVSIRVLAGPRIAFGRLGVSVEVCALPALRTDRRPVGGPLVVGEGMTAAVAEPGSRVYSPCSLIIRDGRRRSPRDARTTAGKVVPDDRG
jgi:hypothetical protein